MSEQSASTQDSAPYGWQDDWQSPPQAANALSVGIVDIRVNRKVCPECGSEVASHAQSCLECGENLVRAPKQIRCMHCHTTASSELVVCPGCGRELCEAPPKLMTIGAPALVALLVVALLVSQWGRISPIAWARTNLLRGAVLVEDISASMEPNMVIVMTPIVPETTMIAVGDASPSIGTDGTMADAVVTLAPDTSAAGDAQAVAMAPGTNDGIAATGAEPGSVEPKEVLAASVVQELPFGVGGPQPEDQAQAAAVVPESLPPVDEAPEAPTATPLPPTPTATATSEPTSALPTATTAPTDIPDGESSGASVAKASGLAATLATDEPASTPTPTWTVVASGTGGDGEAERSVAVAALAANGTSLPTPTVAPTSATTPVSTPTATPIVYQVRAGDTLVSIASSYGVEVEALMAVNEMGEQDVFVLQPGQMLYVPVPTPEPQVIAAGGVTNARVEAPQLVVPTSDARIGCGTGGTLIWQRVQFVKDSDKYVLHLGFVSGPDRDGQESVTWILAQNSPVTVTEWQLDTSLCELAPDEYDHQWRWWVEVVETVDGATVSVSPPSEVRGFIWE